MSTAAPAWFNNAVVNGVQLLYSLSLPGCPAAEVLPLTTTGWIDVLWRGGVWDEALDARRVARAFFTLARACDRWPPPRQLLDHLPPRPDLPAIGAAAPPCSAERRAELAALRRRLSDRMTSVSTSTPSSACPRRGDCPPAADSRIVGAAAQAGEDRAGRKTS